jgi:hypothetical protein
MVRGEAVRILQLTFDSLTFSRKIRVSLSFLPFFLNLITLIMGFQETEAVSKISDNNLQTKVSKSTTVSQDNSSQKSLESDRRSARSEEQILAHFGKRQQLRRNFSLVSCLGLGCTLSMFCL